MSRVLVTGVDGFTGLYLAPLLAAQGHEVHGLVQHLPAAGAASPKGVHALHASDLLDADGLQRVCAAVRPDRVAHLAGIALVSHRDVGLIYRVNLIGTRMLLEALSATDAPPAAILLASSANIYGNSTAGVLDETTVPAPANDYGVSKLAMEYMASTWQARLPITVVRPFNYTGIGQSEDFLLPKIVSHFRRKAPVLELGNLHVERDFSDVRDVAAVYQRLLESPAVGQVFNVCSGVGHALQDVLEMAADISGHRPDIRVNPAFVRANEVVKLVGSRQRLDTAIGHFPRHTLRETLAWMLG
jgi:nucleoside-diphosphate-sugar epimerase